MKIAIKKKQRTETEKEAKKIKSDNFTESNREKKIEQVDNTEIILHFGCTNHIFSD